ncbi:MAG: Asp-tRNA(Asn)/Glu-tRNA(Gln) amidotransferase subunit GatA [Eggerthellaceae bacterium]|nr:Asp-tRNA(Asn)/Glu-tRNA(Gln) amidotransferase subunit GatA [Eggerthellaceae bacterium]
MMHFAQMEISEIQKGLDSGQFNLTEIASDALSHAQSCDKLVKAFLEYLPEEDAIKTVPEKGLLRGVPMGFKDNMNLFGTHTTCSSKMLENYMSTYTATCVQNSLDAGCLCVGKMNMDEFAFGSSTETSAFKKTHNPWDLERVPGGSSGGSSAAVASGQLCVSLGSDTGGSIRQPASFCGVVGVKPTYGVVSRYGVVAFGSSLDQVGPMARSVEDAAICLQAISGRDSKDCTSQSNKTDFVFIVNEVRKRSESEEKPLQGFKIGLVPCFMEAKGLQDEVKEKIHELVALCENLGAELVEVELEHAKSAISAYYVLGPCEAFSNLARFDSVRYGYADSGHKSLGEQYEASRSKGFGQEVKRRILLGSYLLSSGVYNEYYYPAQQIRTLITQDFEKAFEQVDALLTPTSPRTAFKFGEVTDPTEMYLFDMFTVPINIAGNGGMNLPVGIGKDSNLPVGAQIISPAFKDENMFILAAAIETRVGKAQVAPDFLEVN